MTPTSTTNRPRVGARVILKRTDGFLLDHHGAVTGAVGTVVEHSHLTADDDGVLVDWGRGGPVRCSLDELTATEPGEHMLVEKPRYARAVLYDGTNLLQVRAIAGPCLEPPTGTWVVATGDGTVQHLTQRALDAHYDRVVGGDDG